MKWKSVSAVLLVFSFLFLVSVTGCGISAQQYEELASQLREAQEQNAAFQNEVNQLEGQNENLEAQSQNYQAEVAGLQKQIGALKEEYELVGATPAETAEKVVQYYHETHVYSLYDLFVCSDMAAEVWNMLKAQGINAVIAVGSIDAPVSGIVQCDHAWVLAEVAPGQYLALETTGGFVVPESSNPRYYRGWYFTTPKELKDYNRLIQEYNVRLGIRNELADEANRVRDEHNQSTSQSAADKLKAVHDELIELVRQHEDGLNDVMAEIDRLAKVL
ncbi:hypothetical protein ACFLWN_00140 [Chloroflexota bacterium]